MSGGQLVVLDRLGRDSKRFPLAAGLATLGSDPACDIRILLPSVSPHHATVVVHANQTLVRNVCSGETQVNGRCVSVAALRHRDVITIGGRHLRWEYDDVSARRPQAPEPALHASGRGRRAGGGASGGAGRAARRGSGPAPPPRARHVALALEMSHRASMPGNAGGKQVAIVQPQRRDTSDQIDNSSNRTPVQASKRPRTCKSDADTSVSDADGDQGRRQAGRASPNTLRTLQNTTKATLWIESRKSSPRKSAKLQTATYDQVLRRRRTTSAHKDPSLRLAVLKRAQSAQKMRVTKIEAPLMDHTKQAAIMLMTGRSPAPRRPAAASLCAPGLLVRRRARTTPRPAVHHFIDIVHYEGQNSSPQTSTASRRSGKKSPKKSPTKTSPRKSALRDPSAKRGSRKTESIKFDLSNLENHSQDDVMMVTDSTSTQYDSASDDDITLRYSESSGVQSPSPSPRRSIHSRSSRILEKSLGSTVNASPTSRTLTPQSPRPKRSSRGTMMIQKALNETETLSYSRRTTKSMSDKSQDASVATAFRTRTLSPRTPRNDLESYSIVDLVSDESGPSTSVYNSAASIGNTTFGTPQNSTGRKTRSTIDPTLLGSSTPYVKGRATRSRSNPSPYNSSKASNDTQSTTRSSKSRRSKSLSTPENTEDAKKHISVNSTRISRASRSRSRLNDSDLLLLDDDDESPRTSKRTSTASKSTGSNVLAGNDVTPTHSPAQHEGPSTPENRHSPKEASTPVLSIQSLLNSSQSSLVSQRSSRKGRSPFNAKRKTIGGVSGLKTRVGAKSKSMNFSARKTRLRLSSDSVEALNKKNDQENSGIVTPTSAVELVQEGVKNKHSTAKKPQSKRSIIDDLNESDFVKQLFNSPVKRKLSQSMTEFSRKQLFDDDDMEQARRPTRKTIALTGRTPDSSLFDHTDSYTPEMFVSPISTPRHSPNLEGIKLLFAKTTPENDLSDVRGVKGLLRTPRTRRSIKNDLTDVSGVKNMFAKSPENRLSDVRVKEVFASSPKNDLTRVSGVKSLFQSTKKRKSPRNELDDVRGVKKLFKKNSPKNDLRNVSGVKRTLRRNSPKNDLSDVRGVKRMFRRGKRNDLNDVSGVEELFNSSNQSNRDAESLFDQLVGKPRIKAVYSKTFSTKAVHKKKGRKSKTLHASLDVITNNVEDWLQQELNKRLHKVHEQSVSNTLNKSKASTTRELQNLATETVEGNAPVRTSRIRNSTIIRSNESNIDRKKSAFEVYSAHTLPIKKRSLVEVSMEKGNTSRAKLPIKKRVVVHSTPVKGRVNMTMNASVLGRVSPIVAVDETRYTEQDTSITSTQPKETTEVIPKSRRGTRVKPESVETTTATEFVKPSPKKTRGKAKVVSPKTKQVSPAKAKAPKPVKSSSAKSKKPSPVKNLSSPVPIKTTRSRRKDASIIDSNLKKRGATLVVTKNSPVMSPKPRASRKRKEPEPPSTPKPSPKKTRATRRNESVKSDKPKTPKTTRAKVQRATVVVGKPSPQLKPRATKTRAQADLPEAENTKKTRRPATVQITKPESPKKSQVQPKSMSKTRAEGQSAPKTRGRKTANDTKEKAIDVEKLEPKAKKGRKTEEPTSKKTRSNKQENIIEEPKTVRTRGKKVNSQESVQSEPTARSRRAAKPSTTPEVKTRKRKSSGPDNEIPPKVAKSKEVAARGRQRKPEEKTESINTRNKSAKESKVEKGSEMPVKSTRGKKTAEVETVKVAKETEEKTTRGRKANIENVPANQVTGKRKRATVTEPQPAQERAGKKQRGKAAAGAPGSRAPRAPRAARAARADTAPAGKAAGRSRRR